MQERVDAIERWCLDELNRLAQADDGNRPARAYLLNSLAWCQATYPSVAMRDGAKAVENAQKACALTERSIANYIRHACRRLCGGRRLRRGCQRGEGSGRIGRKPG